MTKCLYASTASLCLPSRKRERAICLMLSALLGLRMLQTWNCSSDSCILPSCLSIKPCT